MTFDLLQGQICCRAGDHNSLNLLLIFQLFNKPSGALSLSAIQQTIRCFVFFSYSTNQPILCLFQLFNKPSGALGRNFFDNMDPLMPENEETYAEYRETSGRFFLDPGQYILVPTTQLPNQSRDYLMRVFSVSKMECWYVFLSVTWWSLGDNCSVWRLLFPKGLLHDSLWHFIDNYLVYN